MAYKPFLDIICYDFIVLYFQFKITCLILLTISYFKYLIKFFTIVIVLFPSSSFPASRGYSNRNPADPEA